MDKLKEKLKQDLTAYKKGHLTNKDAVERIISHFRKYIQVYKKL